MTESDWGAAGNYYSREFPQGVEAAESRSIAAAWQPLLEEYEPDLKRRVQTAVRVSGQSIRDQLRTETALRLSAGDQHVSVPVRVVDGIPPPLWVLRDLPPEVLRLVLARGLIAQSADGVRFVRQHLGAVHRFLATGAPAREPRPDEREVAPVEDLLWELARELEKVELFDEIWRKPIDWLGAYFFWKPAIEIYWIPIGLAAAICKVNVEALTYVVLAHELAHAYTHLGRDIDGNVWDMAHFARTDVYIVEGLAQHYTQVLCKKVQLRNPAALEAFEAMLERQKPGPYADWLEWNRGVRDPGENTRRCMLDVRKRGIREYSQFKEILRMPRQSGV